MIQIDNVKMWETILCELPESELTDAIVSALEKQDFRYDGEHIVPIEPEQKTSDDELTEFEKAIIIAISDYEVNKEDGFTEMQSAKKHSYFILKAARKIESEERIGITKKDFEEALEQEWKGYNDRGAATVDALEDNAQELAFAKGFYRGSKWKKTHMMTNATEVTVHIEAGNYPYIPQIELYDYDKDVPLAKEGDRYKVILIKED